MRDDLQRTYEDGHLIYVISLALVLSFPRINHFPGSLVLAESVLWMEIRKVLPRIYDHLIANTWIANSDCHFIQVGRATGSGSPGHPRVRIGGYSGRAARVLDPYGYGSAPLRHVFIASYKEAKM
jgi:hypothetical protein